VISRRFLLGAAPVALAAHHLPAVATTTAPHTWGAELDRLAIDYYATGVRAGFMTVADVRRAEGFQSFDLADLLR
jgi:hypothetical protein